jgi:exopolysaccharide biosynthesis polyprenyl glycosylphosphotransferase
MSSLGVEHKNYSLQVPPASRLIPGKQSAEISARKKSQSVILDTGYWAGNNTNEPAPSEREDTLISLLAESVLPRPSGDSDRSQIVWAIAADLVLLTVCIGLLDLFAQRTLSSSLFGILLIYGSVLTLLGHSEGLYRAHAKSEEFEMMVLGKTIAWATILLVVFVRLTEWQALPAELLLASAPLNYFGMLAWRKAVRLHEHARIRTVRNVLIVGAGHLGRQIARHINQHHPGGRFFRGFLDDANDASEVRGKIADITKIARAHFVDEIIVAIPHQRERAQQVIREARRNHLDIKVVPDLMGYQPLGDTLEPFGVVPLVTLHSESAPALKLLLKRSIDFLFSGITLLLSSPLMLAIGLAIKLDSAGPIFYRAPRMGKKGRQFLCYKFRTMSVNAEQMKEKLRADNQREGPFFKIADDPRLTGLGRFLRRYSLDELPQLWNVLLGDMSLVGPRPHPLDDFRRYRLEDFRRLDVTPGLTGLWQVTARRDPSFQRNMALDLQYIEQWNLLLDLKILWKTLSVVVHGTGA